MSEQELRKQLAEIREKGFDDSFAQFCGDTFSSYEYPGERLAAAKMHAHFLRLFIEEYLLHPNPERRQEYYIKVGMAAIQEVSKSEHPTGVDICKAFIEKWCRFCAGKETE